LGAEEVPGEVLAEISTELVKLHHRVYGRGPTRAQTFSREDTVVCLLGEVLTTPERTLVAEGHVDAVNRLRSDLHETMEGPAKTIVEEATGRTVIAYISAVRPDADLAVEVFVLEAISVS
jgi:uncharacterized protein YbcI